MTDGEHYLTAHQIVEYLETVGIHTHRQTVSSDIEELKNLGIDVVCVKSSQNRYYINDRAFTMPELTLLVDAVSAARSITQEQSDVLIKNLSELAGSYNAKKLIKMAEKGRIKSDNPDIMEIIDTINRGMDLNKQLSYKYFDIDENLEPNYRYDGKSVKISPYDLVWIEDRYYLVGFSVKHKKEITVRVDRMSDVKVTKDIRVPAPDGYNVDNYIKHVFKMFDGTMQTVEFKCMTKETVIAVIDKFGTDVIVEPSKDDTYTVITVEASVSKTFYSWVFQFGNNMEIISPKLVRTEYSKMCQEIVKLYM
jgi:predicted DNA-binding transcriptional regulator YafY